MRNIIRILCICLVMAFVLAGCGKDVPEMPETSAAPAHDHTFIKWFYDADNHGYVCDCGAQDAQPHDLDEYGWCATCEFSVVKNDDGSYSIITFDERDNMSGYINYDADGNVLFELVCINEYYEDGNISHSWDYHDGVLMYESIYLPCENTEFGEVYLSEDITYLEDMKLVTTFDEEWHILASRYYDAQGNLTSEEIYEYVYDENGYLTYSYCMVDGVKASESYYETDADGFTNLVRDVYFDENGDIQDEYTYEYEN